MNNAKQVYLAIAMYVDDSDDFFPPSDVPNTVHESGFNRNWHDYVANYIYPFDEMNSPGHSPTLNHAWNDELGATVFRCPSASVDFMTAYGVTGSYAYYASYGVSNYFSLDYDTDLTGTRITRVSSERIYAADGSSTGTLNVNLFPTIYGVMPRHGGGGGGMISKIFVGGHVLQDADDFAGGYSDYLEFPWGE